MSEQQDRNFFADGVTFMMKRALVLVSVVALLVAIVAVQMSPRNASADEAQASHPSESAAADVESDGSAPASGGIDVSDVPQADDGEVGTETGNLPKDEPSVIDTATELNAPELQTPKPAERLPQEYEDALANWPADEASEFREYYLAHPDELELIDVKRLIREGTPVVQRFDVRAAGNGPSHDPSKECGLKIAIITDVTSSINENDPNGLQKIKDATKAAIDQLSGTSTTLGLYNFATDANPVPSAKYEPQVMTPENARQAKQAVDRLTTGSGERYNITNWYEGLRQVEGENFDSVIFITDGVPNAPPNGNGGGLQIPNGFSLRKAQEVADRITDRRSGGKYTSVFPIFIGNDDRREVNLPYCRVVNEKNICTQVGFIIGLPKNIASFVDKTQRPRGVEYSDVTKMSAFAPSLSESELANVDCNSRETYNVPGYGILYHNGSCTIDVDGRKKDVFTKGKSQPSLIAGSLSRDGKATVIDEFGALAVKLKKLTEGCQVNPPAPKISFEKYVKAWNTDAVEADSKKDALDLRNDNDHGSFSQDFVVTNKGVSPIGYFELTDRQLEVPSSEDDSLSLDGLTCSGAEVNLSSDKKTARITPNNPVSENQSVRCTQTLDIGSVTFRNVDNPTAPDKFFGDEATVTAKTSAQSTQATTVKDAAWAKSQPDLQIFKSYNPGTPRTITGKVGQQFTADYNIILTNNSYVEGSFPAIIDTPKPAPGLRIVSMTAFDREIDRNSSGNLSAQQEVIRGGSANLTHESGNSWKLASGDLLPFKPRSKGQLRLRVTYEVERVLQGKESEKYICKKVRGSANNGTGLNNTLDVETGSGLTPVAGDTRDVCYSVLRADTSVIKKINGAGDPVNPADGVTEQKAGKTVDNPENKDSFSVSYVIRNDSRSGRKYSADRPNADLPPSDIVSVKLEDYALDDAGVRTGDKVNVQELACSGNDSTKARGTYDADSDTVTFDPALPAGESVTCTGTVHLQNLGSHVYGGVHGDEVVVTPTYRLNVGQTPGEIPSNDDSDEMTVTGPEESDKAWVRFPSSSVKVEKLINDEEADSKETAAAVIPGAPTVKISYRVTNDGNGDIASFIVSDRYGENADSGERMNIGEMQCDKNATVNVSGPEAAVSPAAALGRGESITCWWNASNPSAMRYNDDSYHVDTATVNATFRQDFIGDIQASDSAWAIQLKSLDGKLPKSGGLGIAPFGLGALILFAGALFISRRQRKA
ncbi:vWA domain-containing protein [Corynebacterium sp. TAE3-ERU16]|uniref:vWA domain-containing protein n=1 Tax=Corynebacterium sp. TAE3-ERU16 TaxID=2849493 RepID=UPI001C467219|nr:vWA domain-containing protein [Corynebacterium sp. TAE3-ERU16]MBV7293528.1 VWA domain-containing protein [Corynebacterium sp. TAE3-ERU16]